MYNIKHAPHIKVTYDSSAHVGTAPRFHQVLSKNLKHDVPQYTLQLNGMLLATTTDAR